MCGEGPGLGWQARFVREAGVVEGKQVMSIGLAARSSVWLGALAFSGMAWGGTLNVASWNNDGDIGIDRLKTYTHKINFRHDDGAQGAAVVNGVTFTGTAGTTSGANWSLAGTSANVYNNGSGIPNNGGKLVTDFFYIAGGPVSAASTVTLTGLTPGQVYLTAFYNRAWGGAGTRVIEFKPSDTGVGTLLDQNAGDTSSRWLYAFTAPPSGTISYAFASTADNASYHQYAFSNEEVPAAPSVPTIVNAGFEYADGFAYPGYGKPAGWTSSNPTATGVNTAAGPFASNGAIPEGTQVGLIQTANSLRQIVGGFTVGGRYMVSCRCNARDGNQPTLKISVGGTQVWIGSFGAVGGANGYYLAAGLYTATATSAELKIENTQSGYDNTVLIDDVRIGAVADAWTLASLTGDADSRIVQKAFYTHMLDTAGTAGGRSVNGVQFERPAAPVGGSVSGSNWSMTGVPSGVGSQPPAGVSGNIRTILSDFWYNGFPETVTLSGLLAGSSYVATFHGYAYGGAGGRGVDLRTDDGNGGPTLDTLRFDQNYTGAGNGNLLEYAYTAPASGKIRFSFAPVSGTFHQYSVCNRYLIATNRTVLFAESFNSGTQETDINTGRAARQSGALAPLTYTQGGPANGHQVGDPTTRHPNTLELLSAGWAGIDRNFRGGDTLRGLTINFDMDPNWAANGSWGAICVGADDFGSGGTAGWVNRGGAHFGVLFRGNGTLQAFDGGTNLTPSEPSWGGTAGVLHHFRVAITDPVNSNPFDGIGSTKIEIFVDGGLTPVYTYTKTGGGYANNYINFQGIDSRTEVDNLLIETVPTQGSVFMVR